VLDQPPEIQERGVIGHACRLLHVVRDDHERVAVLQLRHQLLDLRRRDRIERGAGLVQEDHLGLDRDGARDAQTLLLPAGEAERTFVEPVLRLLPQRGAAEAALDDLLQLGAPVHALDAAAVGHVLENRLRERVGFLEHHTDARAQGRDVDLGRVQVRAVEAQAPFDSHLVDQVVQPIEAAQQGGFAAARRADEGGDPLLGNLERDGVERLRVAVPERERFGREHRLVDPGQRGRRVVHHDAQILRAVRRFRVVWVDGHGGSHQMLRVAYFSRKWFRTRMATRLAASTTAIKRSAVANTSGFAASTLGLWKPTS